ncbi:MAG: glycine zipper 2TM domain-containing protein [Halomonadaceae bacterium]|nr:MAG: glycine zipper 2TM domain-containing protein [Halomonadaceae bacterium]
MKKMILVAAISTMTLVGCSTTNPYTDEEETSRSTIGAAIGAVTGAAVGAATSSRGDRRKGILIGAAAGGIAGAGVGVYMDRQEEELRQQLRGTGVSVAREGDQIRLVMPGNVTFAVNQATIQPSFHEVLGSVALVLQEFEETAISIGGHTDSTGSLELNQGLSERRAESVGDFLRQQGVSRGRLHTRGYGPREPIASNDTEAGRQANRRVELQLMPMQ